eukprot:2219767-Rhodomonas_salina.3
MAPAGTDDPRDHRISTSRWQHVTCSTFDCAPRALSSLSLAPAVPFCAPTPRRHPPSASSPTQNQGEREDREGTRRAVDREQTRTRRKQG